jgi:probable rRNA maturation factor
LSHLELELQQAVPVAPGQPTEADFRHWAESALPLDGAPVELVVRIVDEAESGQLNRDYRGKEGPTNVLSFPFEAPPEVPSPLLGDLVICAPVVAREAAQQGKAPQAHWAHMVIHGVLHLLGYDHMTDEEAQLMEDRECELLHRLHFPNPYIDEDR